MMQVTRAALHDQVSLFTQATDPMSHTPVYDDTTRDGGLVTYKSNDRPHALRRDDIADLLEAKALLDELAASSD